MTKLDNRLNGVQGLIFASRLIPKMGQTSWQTRVNKDSRAPSGREIAYSREGDLLFFLFLWTDPVLAASVCQQVHRL